MTGILETLAGIAGLGSAAKDIADVLANHIDLEDALADLVNEKFQQQVPRIQHLCPTGTPSFDKDAFRQKVASTDWNIANPEDITRRLLPILAHAITTPGATCDEAAFSPIFESILNSAARAWWNKISRLPHIANRTLLAQGDTLTKSHADIRARLDSVMPLLEQIAGFAKQVHTKAWDARLDSAPPTYHTIDTHQFANPFVLSRSEDFNHNYDKLARLFHGSPEWDSVRSRTANVFIEGGRGTGKSMLLRMLTAQATVAAARISNKQANFDAVKEDYFGVYVKLTRGYYDQFQASERVPEQVASLLAQHELNVEIFDAFVDTLKWLDAERALPEPSDRWRSLCADLSCLFRKAARADRLDDLARIVRFEQDQILDYYTNVAFGKQVDYAGSAIDTVAFLRRLSSIFRKHLFPRKEIRLFLLIDEFETLLEIQQRAVNTAIKMRLPDLSLKIAARRDGRKTAETFTAGDPIQDPRDYTPLYVDYDVTDPEYKNFLGGIAAKRLEDAHYPIANLRQFLIEQKSEDEVDAGQLSQELSQMWNSGSRRTSTVNDEFREKYGRTAVYRVLAKSNKDKTYSGFDQFALLSSGIVSNFIELCKYAFYFALSDELSLSTEPAIPPYLQSRAVYAVSERLLATIDGNVPQVGGVLGLLVRDLGALLRSRLLNDASEPEANRLEVIDYGSLDRDEYRQLRGVLDQGVTWSVLHLLGPGEGFRPKQHTRPPAAEILLNRIYAPALGISPRARWRVPCSVTDLNGLVDSSTREQTYRKLTLSIGSAAPKPGNLFPE